MSGNVPTSWRIGAVQIDRVLEHERPLLAPETLFPEFRQSTFDYHADRLAPALYDRVSGLLMLAFHSFVIRTPWHTIIVDTCTGNHKSRPHKQRYHMNRWPYLARLRAAGVSPEDVDFVVCTHLHADHVGWNTTLIDNQWQVTFPNASYLVTDVEYEHWQDEAKRSVYTDDPYFEDSVLPVVEAGQMQWVGTEHVIDPCVRLSGSPGHTPGHICILIESDGVLGVMSGDIFHHPIQCAEPSWNSCFCVDRRQAFETRSRFLEDYADSGVMVLPAHFPTPGVGWINRSDDGFSFNFINHS